METDTSNDGTSDDGRGVGGDQNNVIHALGRHSNTIAFSDISLTSEVAQMPDAIIGATALLRACWDFSCLTTNILRT